MGSLATYEATKFKKRTQGQVSNGLGKSGAPSPKKDKVGPPKLVAPTNSTKHGFFVKRPLPCFGKSSQQILPNDGMIWVVPLPSNSGK